MKTRLQYETTRMNCNLPSKLVERLKAYSEHIGMPYTQTMTLLLTQALDNQKAWEEIPKITNMYEDYKKNYDNRDSLI